MAGVTLQTLVNTTRRLLRDWPVYERTSGPVLITDTAITVTDGSQYAVRWNLELDFESMTITSIVNNSLSVLRGTYGSTTVAHSTGTDILMNPVFKTIEIIDAINMAIDAAFPFFYLFVQDTSVFATDSTYEYIIPNMPNNYDLGSLLQIPVVTKVEIKQTSDLTFRELRRWQIRQGPDGARLIKIRTAEPAGGQFRINGYGPFPHLAAATDSLDESWPKGGQLLPALYAAAHLMMSAEAGRDRGDFEAVDSREEANKPLVSLQTGQSLYNRWMRETLQLAMPPIPKHYQQPI